MQEIVIKIPNSLYANLKKIKGDSIAGKRIVDCVINGTVLPKGHGKLKDFDKIEWYGCDFEGKACERANGDCSVCNFGNCDAKQVRELPTIIEADRSEE